MMRLTLVFILLFAVPLVSFSATINIPADYSTIQQGIDASVNGDTVLVAPGTYQESINFNGKAIFVKGAEGAEKTVIDGKSWVSVVKFQSGEGLDSVLEGFTITNGDAKEGGGIKCYHSSPTIRENIITENKVWWQGAGIYCDHSDATISSNVISNNTSTEDGGGITVWYFSNPSIVNNIIRNNVAGSKGEGGGIFIIKSDPLISNTIFFSNTAGRGGGVAGCESSAIIVNCTFSLNFAEWGGGISFRDSSHPTVTNSILWGDFNREIYIPYGKPDITFCDIYGGWPGTGNMEKDPRFVDPKSGDLHLFILSPCIDTGTNSTPHLSEFDFEGDPRVVHDTVDMGADEATFTLMMSAKMISASQGEAVDFSLHGGVDNAYRGYILLGSMSGTEPGTPLPGGQVTLPLNWDLLTSTIIAYLNTPIFWNFMNLLDTNGDNCAQLNPSGPLPPGTVGLVFNFAYALNKPWDFASNPVGIEIVP